MRILFVAARHPSPPLRGDQVRAWNQVRVLSRRHQVTVVALERGEPGASLPDGVRLVTCESGVLARSLPECCAS